MKKIFRLWMVSVLAGSMLFGATAQAAPQAANPMEKAIEWAMGIAADNRHGYSQGKENATASRPYTGSREGPDYDCSSLIYHALDQAGFPVIAAWQKNPAYWSRYQGKQLTGDADTLWTDLQKLGGFQKYPWYAVKNSLQRGDILCNPGYHIAIYVGNGWTVEARGVNNPIGGDWRTGDQGGEIDCYSAYGRGWTEVYRYTGK
ncbi:NlpC/P60 family protein [Selenomonas ruminantium]|nr:NlpC/P60 family protein [Selenomonas ruminantium]